MPPKKRKSNDYLDQIMDMKRKREAGGQPNDLDEGGVSGDNVGPSFEFSAGSAVGVTHTRHGKTFKPLQDKRLQVVL